MRILTVRFKNLNSLVGEWAIDFTHPAFASDGIFAITGPTGSGKTTILDAICLALYGQTPRLHKVTKSENEIMSRQTGECFAEVTFETQSGHYRCHWSQRRSRKKPDGELQTPKHEIVNASSNLILDTKLRGVAYQIELATGMNFDRFTRSMLLAQGGFAAFLQAAPDERAPILEQITGTEIYSQISMGVHERRAEEGKKLGVIHATMAGMQLLSEEDAEQLEGLLQHNVISENALNSQLVTNNAAMTWLKTVAILKEELRVLDEKKQVILQRQEALHPVFMTLDRAKRCMEIAGEFASLEAMRKEQALSLRRLGECQQLLPALNLQVKNSDELLTRSNIQCEQKKSELKDILPLLRKVREIDIQLKEKDPAIAHLMGSIIENEDLLKQLQTAYHQNLSEQHLKTLELETLQNRLIEHKEDEGLVEYLAGIRSRFDAMRVLYQKNVEQTRELVAAESHSQTSHQLCQAQSKLLIAKQGALDVAQERILQLQTALCELTTGCTIADWRILLTDLNARRDALKKIIESVQCVHELRERLNTQNQSYELLIINKNTVVHQLRVEGEGVHSLEREKDLLETQLMLLNKIKDFEDSRHQLVDGESCPLCGAKDHPFAMGNVPVPDETQASLHQVKIQLKTANEVLSGLNIKHTEIVKDLERTVEKTTEFTQKIALEEAQINDGLVALSIVLNHQSVEVVLNDLVVDIENKLENVNHVVKTAEGSEKIISTLCESLEKDKSILIQLERDSQRLLHQKDTAEQSVTRAKQVLTNLAAEFKMAEACALSDVASYGIKSLSLDLLESVQVDLIMRRDQWLIWQKQKIELEKDRSNLALQTKHQTIQLLQCETELKKRRASHVLLTAERDALFRERVLLLSDKNPDEEESRLTNLIIAADRELEDVRQMFNANKEVLSQLKSEAEIIEKSMFARGVQLKQVDSLFNVSLNQLGFESEESYLAAVLPEEERTRLAQQVEQFVNDKTELDTRYGDKTALLQMELQREVTETCLENLAEEHESLTGRLKVLQQEIGGLRQKIADNHNLRQKYKEKTAAFEAQSTECLRWDRLHALIGSVDGKKYRNFAQGLTFEMMIGHANRQLQKMTDRYLLQRDKCQPLELNVVDNYQAGEIRSTKNLSGGEGFIVSLSLALGLSYMASKNVRVDSLFLDEGFGTLDEEALDLALETLSGLQQDGKLIGVISHVQTLKERISTQIQVSYQTGGRSVVSGPGCSRLSHTEIETQRISESLLKKTTEIAAVC